MSKKELTEVERTLVSDFAHAWRSIADARLTNERWICAQRYLEDAKQEFESVNQVYEKQFKDLKDEYKPAIAQVPGGKVVTGFGKVVIRAGSRKWDLDALDKLAIDIPTVWGIIRHLRSQTDPVFYVED